MPDSVFKRIGSVVATKIDAVKTELQTEIQNVGLTIDKASLGLDNVDNTSDLNKPISTATQIALDAKQSADPNLVSDANYVHTDNNFTTTEKTKLAGIADGANNYSLPTASDTVLGGVKVDGTSITIDGQGVISGASTYSLPTASETVLGGVKVDGTTILVDGQGVLSASATSYTLPTSSPTVLGGIKVDGTTLKIDGQGVASVANDHITLIRYLSQPGSLSLFTGKARWYPPQGVNVLWLEASVDTPATGSGITAVLKKNGSVINSVTLNAGENKSTRVNLSEVVGTINDYFTVDVTAVGSTTPGSDLIIAVAYSYQ